MPKKIAIPILISFVNALSFSVIIPVIYQYGKSFNLTEVEVSFLLTAFALSQFFATPIIGRLSDYFGRKPLLIISLAGTVIGNFLAFFANSPALLFSARILDGITGGNNSVAQAVISDVAEPEERGKAFGLFGASFGVAFIIGPLVSIPFQEISLAAPFLLASGSALIACLLTIFYLPETNKHKADHLNFKNLGFANLTKVFKRSTLGTVFLIVSLCAFSFGSFQFGFQPLVVEKYQASTQDISLSLLVFGVSSAFTQAVLVPYLSKRYRYDQIMLLSLSLSFIFILIFTLPKEFWLFLCVAPLYGLSSFMYRPMASALVSDASKPEEKGTMMGVLESYYSISSAMGPLAAGLVLAWSVNSAFFLSAGAVLLAIVILLFNRRFIRKQQS